VKKLFSVLLLVAQPLFAQQSHPLSEITPIDSNLNMGSYNISTNDLTVSGRDIWMGGASGQVWGLRYSKTYPNYGIFYQEGSTDFFAISPGGGGTTSPDLKINGNGNVTVNGYLIVNGAGAVLPANSVDSNEVNFNYAGSGSKGGAASDLSCTTCVASGEVNFNYAGSGSKGGAASDLSCTDCVALGTETAGNYAGSNAEAGGANSCDGDTTCEAGALSATGTSTSSITHGDLTYGTGTAVTLSLGTDGSKSGAIRFYGGTAASPSYIQQTTNNLHIDANNGLYLNYYDGGTIYFGTGASGYHSYITTGGNLNLGGNLTINGNDLIFSGGEKITGISVDGIGFFQNRADDTSYEWIGFYSGTTRQGIILYDGAWAGCDNSATDFCIVSENSNRLVLKSATGTTYNVGNLQTSGDITASGGQIYASEFCDSTYDVCANSLNDGYMHIQNKAKNAYKGIAASQFYMSDSGTYIKNNAGRFEIQDDVNVVGDLNVTGDLLLQSSGFSGTCGSATVGAFRVHSYCSSTSDITARLQVCTQSSGYTWVNVATVTVADLQTCGGGGRGGFIQ